MLDALIYLGLFTAKAIIILLIILFVLIAFFALLSKGKDKVKARLVIKNLNHKYAENAETLLIETLSKKEFKQFQKQKKTEDKAKKQNKKTKNVFVIHFQGDLRASETSSLSEEVNSLLSVATPEDEVVVKLESSGGMVHAYGLAAAQLMRIRARNIPLVIAIDKVAASGGYMVASIADKILCAPFAIIGSIGVIVQLPNFHRLLKDHHIDFEQLTAGEFKRTITMFGHNTEEGRQKLQEEIEDIHQRFKELIKEHRPQLDIQRVATGEYWLGKQAAELNLVDEIKTSDDYLFECAQHANVYEVCYEIKKPLLARLTAPAARLHAKLTAQNRLPF